MRSVLVTLFLFIFLMIPAGMSRAADDTSIHILFNTDSIQTEDYFLELFGEFTRAAKECGASVDFKAVHRITDESLSGYDVFIIYMPAMKLLDSDKSTLRRFISDGGSVLFITWLTMLGTDNANLEGFTADYGITFGSKDIPFAFYANVVQTSALAGPEKAEYLDVLFPQEVIAAPGEAENALVTDGTNTPFCVYSVKKSVLGKGRLVVLGDNAFILDVLIRDKDGLPFTRNLIRYLGGDANVPDLAVQTLALKAKHVFPGDSISFGATVKNGGDAEAAATNITFTLHTYDSATKSAGAVVKKLRSFGLNALAGGAEQTFSTSAKIPGALEPGEYVVVATVKTVSGETDTSDNTRMSKRFTVH